MIINADDHRAAAVTDAIRRGDAEQLRRLLDRRPDLASVGIRTDGDGAGVRSLLHIATDWPGHFPNGVAVVTLLVAAGADVNARFIGSHSETPLHWAASSDDADMVDALLDLGADIEADGGIIGNGTPLDDAVAFAQWNAAARLVERGATIHLFNSAALGMLDRLNANLTMATPPPTSEEIARAFWGACHGGQQTTAARLLELGADINWLTPWDGTSPLDAARRSKADALAAWLIDHAAKPAGELTSNDGRRQRSW
jgi:hypothetical protein